MLIEPAYREINADIFLAFMEKDDCFIQYKKIIAND